MNNPESIRYLLTKKFDAFDIEANIDLNRIIDLTLDDEFEMIDLVVTSLSQPEKVLVRNHAESDSTNTSSRFSSSDERHSAAQAIRSYCEAAKRHMEWLSNLDEDEFEGIVSSQRSIDKRELRELSDNADAVDFFNAPEAIAVLPDWLFIPNWTIDEATALALGRDPNVVNRKSLSTITRESSFKQEYEHLRDIISRAVKSEILENHIKPATFVGWAKAALHPKFVDLSAMIDAFSDEGNERDSKIPPQTKRMVNNLLRIIAALISSKEGFDPTIELSPSARSRMLEGVMSDLSRIGIKGLGAQTVAKRLDEALATAHADSNRAYKV